MGVCDVCLQLKLSIHLYVERSEKCHLYLVENHEVGTRPGPSPRFVSQCKFIMSFSFCMSVMSDVVGAWVDVR